MRKRRTVFFALMMVLQLIWVIFYMPETKGVPLEELEAKLIKNKSLNPTPVLKTNLIKN